MRYALVASLHARLFAERDRADEALGREKEALAVHAQAQLGVLDLMMTQLKLEHLVEGQAARAVVVVVVAKRAVSGVRQRAARGVRMKWRTASMAVTATAAATVSCLKPASLEAHRLHIAQQQTSAYQYGCRKGKIRSLSLRLRIVSH